MNQKCNEKLYTLTEACELLSISTATGRNWMKSGRLTPAACSGKKPVFSETMLSALKAELSSGALPHLKGRRNKTYVSGQFSCHSYIAKESPNHIALQQLLSLWETDSASLTEPMLRCLLRNCAEKLLALSGTETLKQCHTLLENLAPAKAYAAFQEAHASLRSISYTYLAEEDTLGFLYLSLCNIRDRKASGSYYTPAWLAKRLVTEHLPKPECTKTILDPSCGTGIFLLQLPDSIPLKNIHGNDLNPLSVTLTRLNLAMKYKISTPQELELLQSNITVANFLNEDADSDSECITYDIILGNPPWGAKLSSKEKEACRTRFSCAAGSSIETYDLFIEQSIRKLSPNGFLSFVLPEAVLTVKAHTAIRELLLHHTSVHSVEYLGEAFEQVHCPSILLTVTADTDRPFFKDVTVKTKNATYSTQVERVFHADTFYFALSDAEYLLLQKVLACPSHTTLAGKADFALGIVTGNNTALLHSSPAPGLESVIKGTDISKYHINSCSGYLKFQPEQFQQTAPEQFYRAPEKLFYRFISKQLTFAYDNTGLLSLNSCNILIPRLEGLSMKYILAVLNSGVAQFIFEKKFHSVKVLRSHLEQLPIPLAEEAVQQEITLLVDCLLKEDEASLEYREHFEILDRKIADLFGLTAEEYELIRDF